MKGNPNVQVVQKAYEAFSKGDIPGILSQMDPGITFTIPGTQAVAMAGVRKGRAEVEKFFADLANREEFTKFEPHEYIAEGNRVVALVRYEGRDKTTNRNFAVDSAMLWTVVNGKITQFVEYTDTENLAIASGGMRAGGAA